MATVKEYKPKEIKLGAVELNKTIPKNGYDTLEFLKISVQLAENLYLIHKRNIIHKNINPANIIINQDTLKVKLGPSAEAALPELLSIQYLSYISPEQTGRLNIPPDFRSDLYSLGITFYELICGKLPFRSNDPMQLMHFHIAKMPVPPIEIKGTIPQMISDIIMKLLNKTPDDRYQSAIGLKADLDKCLKDFEKDKKIISFELGQYDFSDKIHLPKKVYAREKELTLLSKALENAQIGVPEIVLVSGYSGIGKTTLVSEIQKTIADINGIFISGKFEQLNRNISYFAIKQAFQGLARQILAESESKLKYWKERLISFLGMNAQIIIDLIPEFELILGKQTAVPELGPKETQNRFNYVFKQFIYVFASKDHPLVFFVDNLQWADLASLNLIKNLTIDKDIPHLLLIGAFRSNEVDSTHPAILTIGDIANAGVTISEIYLSPEPSKPLAEIIHTKTGGNPFFVIQLLSYLHRERLIIFKITKLTWEWDIVAIQQKEVSQNVVELTLKYLNSLPKESQKIIALASCIGSKFQVKTLSLISNQEQPEVIKHLPTSDGIVEPVISPFEEYQFIHDKIQQAAYSLIPQNKKKFKHLEIGRLLLESVPEKELYIRIFEILKHFNYDVTLIDDPIERNKIANLNLIAGKKAKDSAAYSTALNYLNQGITLIGKNCWERQYDLSLSLYTTAAEAAYLGGNFNEMERISSIVFDNAKNLLDKTRVYENRILSYNAQKKMPEFFNMAYSVLKQLGISLPKKPSNLNIITELLKTKFLLRNKSMEDLTGMPLITNKHKIVSLRLLSIMVAPTVIYRPKLTAIVALKMLNIIIKYGNSYLSPDSFVTYGVFLCRNPKTADLSHTYGKLAVDLVDKQNIMPSKAKVDMLYHAIVRIWKDNLRESLEPLFNAYQIGRQTGDFEYSVYSVLFYFAYLFYIGTNLSVLKKEMAANKNAVKGLYQTATEKSFLSCYQAVLNLKGENIDPCTLVGSEYDENIVTPDFFKVKDSTRIGFYTVNKLIVCYLFENYTQAYKALIAAEKYPYPINTATMAIYNFYDSLVRLTHTSDKLKLTKHDRNKIIANQKIMWQWARNAPMNYLNKYFLVKAEWARVHNQFRNATKYYDLAIKHANKNGYINEEAIAYESAAKFYLKNGYDEIAKTYMQKSYYLYKKWGADAKVVHLEKKYPEVLKREVFPLAYEYKWDIHTVLKASHALSEEIDLKKLLTSMIKITIENAGAQRGFIIIKDKGQLIIVASTTIEPPETSVLQYIPIDKYKDISSGIIHYVNRTKKHIILSDPTREGEFTHDPYILANHPKSVLCMPMLREKELKGILYLENNAAYDAFTEDRVEVLNTILSQAAISLENAMLFTEIGELNEKLKYLSKLKSDHVSIVAHELRTPLSVIVGFTKTLQDLRLPEEQREKYLNIIATESKRLTALTEKFLDIAKIDAEEIYPTFEMINISDVIEDTIKTITIPEGKEIQFTPTRLSRLKADKDLISDIILNIVENALRYSPSGKKVYIDTKETERDIIVSVEDKGPGIEKQNLEKIFDKYSRLDDSISRTSRGSGLGLAIAKNFTEMHRGKIWAESELGKGTIIYFTIPKHQKRSS
jgi:predicted ATPase/signal transduction histidine kinase